MTPNRALVDEILARMNARELKLDDLCHPEVEWRWPEATPGSSLFREELKMDPYELIEDGLVRRWSMFGDADKARRRFGEGRPPG